MSGVENGMLERLLRANEDQAKAAGALVEIQRDHNSRLESIEGEARQQTVVLTRLVEQLERMDEARIEAVNAVKDHTALAVAAAFKDTTAHVQAVLGDSEKWWRRAIWIAAGLIGLSNILGVGLGRLLEWMKLGR